MRPDGNRIHVRVDAEGAVGLDFENPGLKGARLRSVGGPSRSAGLVEDLQVAVVPEVHAGAGRRGSRLGPAPVRVAAILTSVAAQVAVRLVDHAVGLACHGVAGGNHDAVLRAVDELAGQESVVAFREGRQDCDQGQDEQREEQQRLRCHGKKVPALCLRHTPERPVCRLGVAGN